MAKWSKLMDKPDMEAEEAADILESFLSDCEMGYVVNYDGSDLERSLFDALYAGIYALVSGA